MKNLRPRLRNLLCATAILIAASSRSAVRADVPPPEAQACSQLAVGAKCDKGICQNSTCSKLDYAKWDRDASASPPQTSYPCVRCISASEGSDGGAVGKPKDKDDSGCSLGEATSVGGMSFACGVLALAVSSRRRRFWR